MRCFKLAAAATAVFLIGACGPRPPVGSTAGNNGHAANIPAATPTGPAVTCIPIVQIRESRVRDDWTIDFRMNGNQWYRNALPNRCNALSFERAFTYSTSLQQLCNVDIITVIANGGNPRGPLGSCGLGMFQPVQLAKPGVK